MTTRSRVDLDPLPRSQIIFEKYMHVSIMDTVLSVPLLSGHLSKSRQSFPLAKLTCSKRSSLFDSRGHLFRATSSPGRFSLAPWGRGCFSEVPTSCLLLFSSPLNGCFDKVTILVQQMDCAYHLVVFYFRVFDTRRSRNTLRSFHRGINISLFHHLHLIE